MAKDVKPRFDTGRPESKNHNRPPFPVPSCICTPSPHIPSIPSPPEFFIKQNWVEIFLYLRRGSSEYPCADDILPVIFIAPGEEVTHLKPYNGSAEEPMTGNNWLPGDTNDVEYKIFSYEVGIEFSFRESWPEIFSLQDSYEIFLVGD